MSSQEKIMNAIVELDELNALELAAQMVDSGIDPVEILEQCRKGMSIVGEKFESGDFFLSEMIMAAEIFNQVMRARDEGRGDGKDRSMDWKSGQKL